MIYKAIKAPREKGFAQDCGQKQGSAHVQAYVLDMILN